MLHELLFALLGKPGSIIKEYEDCFQLEENITFLNQSEKQIINQICILGYYFQKIEKFLENNYQSFQKLQIIEKIREKEENEENEIYQEQAVEGNSAYLKAFCFGCEKVLDDYREEVIKIERNFLKERVFTVSSLRIELSTFLEILPDLSQTIEKISQDKIKGGQLIDLVYNKSQTGNRILREVYSQLCLHCYQVLYQQISGWILFGKLQDFYDEFFIYRVEEKDSNGNNKENGLSNINDQPHKEINWEYDWDQLFSLRPQQLPYSYISILQAKTILFIGKGMKVLRSQKEFHSYENQNFDSLNICNSSLLPENHILQLVGQLEQYDSFEFQNVLGKLRYYIANQLLDLVIKKKNLMEHLQIMMSYFLMADGEFYQVFQEESRKLMQFPPQINAEQKLNNIILPQTLLRVRLEDHPLMKKFFFKIKSNGFDYVNFQNLTGLNIVGNVVQSKNHYIRFNPMKTIKQSGSCWYNFRQNIQNGFTMNFQFRFKKEKNFLGGFSKIYSPTKAPIRSTLDLSSQKQFNSEFQSHHLLSPQRSTLANFHSNLNNSSSNNNNNLNKDEDQMYQNVFCLCFQSKKEISTYKKVAPLLLQDLKEYIVVKFGVHEMSKVRNTPVKENYTKCYIEVCHFNREKMKQEQVNFLEESLHVVKLEYKDDNLILYFEDLESKQSNKMDIEQSYNKNRLFKIPMKFQNFLTLDIGKCYVGFLSNSVNANCAVDLMGWSMSGNFLFNSNDSWNGLTLDYKVTWPLNLILSSQVMEKYRTLFRFFFPIRQVKVELHKVWLTFTKSQRRNLPTKNGKEMLKLRNQMSLVIDSLWSYFHLDVIQGSWNNLKQKIEIVDDFENLRKNLDDHLSEITNKVFLQYQNVLESIFQLISQVKSFIRLVQDELEAGTDIELLKPDFENLKDNFESTFSNLLNMLVLMNKNSNQTFLYQLLLKLDYNGYYRNQISEQSYKYQ